MSNKVKIAIAGLGGRGRNTYIASIEKIADRCEIVAIAEPIDETRHIVQEQFNLPDDMCFRTCEELLEQPRLADILIIATQDQQHVSEAVKACEVGYHLLLEKPIATTPEDCRAIQQAAHKYNRYVVVAHVLRYTVFYDQIKRIIESGVIGDIVTVNAIERVAYWHQAHSFVRGNWCNSDESCPMILAKSCHDMDILRWLIGKKCKRVSSFGALSHFKKECAPEGAADRCKDCPDEVRNNCKFEAYSFYRTKFESDEPDALGLWPANILAPVPTWDNCVKALDVGPYGRCVYKCDNNVVDHQIVNMEFEDDVTCNFTMTAFTFNGGRGITVMGTRGEIRGDNASDINTIYVHEFGKPEQVIDVNKIADDLSGHGGGDNRMMADFVNALYEGRKPAFDIDMSMESHYMAFAAEESRLNGGKAIEL